MKRILGIITSSLLVCSFIFGQTGETELYKTYNSTNKELNIVYNKLLQKYNPADKKALVESQKDWLKFRESNCNFKSKDKSEGGVISNKIKISYQIDMTQQRIKELQELLCNF